ncbi:DUF2306 domain-containing protein [Puia sp. P3]|uniref:DUF2306 domain-containing protein n=1 Tax=Puia sp. P3 TaxID=3423952 RepID=UPI003D66D103
MKRISSLLHVVMFFPAAIGVAMVVRRSLAIGGIATGSPPFPGAAGFDADFSRHPFITFLHILPGALFMLLAPLQFLPRIRNGYPRWHRSSGLVVIVCGYIIGISALFMPFFLHPIGGLNESVATSFFAVYFLIALSMAWRAIRRRDIVRHRQWMIRMFSIGVAVGTIRPIVVLFFVFSGLPPQMFFGTAFWLGFSLHLVLAEWYIGYSKFTLHEVGN